MTEHLKIPGSKKPERGAVGETNGASLTPPPLPPTYTCASEEERQLAIELSKVMAFQPHREKHPVTRERPIVTTTEMDATIEPTQLGFQQPQSHTPPPLPTNANNEPRPTEDIDEDVPEEETTGAAKSVNKARWVHAARRSRFRSGVGQAASWIISIGVGGFIIAVVAVMLLGVPQNGLPFSWNSAAAVDQPVEPGSKAHDRLR